MSLEYFFKAEKFEREEKEEEAFSAYSDFIEQQRTSQDHQVTDDTREKLALAYNNRGFLLYLKVEFKLAIENYTQALSLNPSLTVAYYNRGLIHYRLGRFEEAVKDMQKALTLEADFEPAQQCLQQSLKDMERTKR